MYKMSLLVLFHIFRSENSSRLVSVLRPAIAQPGPQQGAGNSLAEERRGGAGHPGPLVVNFKMESRREETQRRDASQTQTRHSGRARLVRGAGTARGLPGLAKALRTPGTNRPAPRAPRPGIAQQRRAVPGAPAQQARLGSQGRVASQGGRQQ